MALTFSPCWAATGRPAPPPCPEATAPLAPALHAALSRAEKLAETGDNAGAANLLARVIESGTGKGHPYAYYDLGYFYYRQTESAKAATALNRALEMAPCFVEAWRLLAAVHQENDRPAPAAGALEKAAALSGCPEDRFHAALLWRDAKRPAKALGVLENLAAGPAPRTEWLLALAHTLLALDRTADAAAAMERVAAADPAPEHLYNAAALWQQADRTERALTLWARLGRRGRPGYEWLAAWIGAAMELGRNAQVDEALGLLLNHFAGRTDAWVLAARVAQQRAKPDMAAAALEVAAHLDANGGERWKEVSRLYQAAGLPVLAARALEKALDGKHSAADWDRLVGIYLNAGRFDLALAPARAAAAAGPSANRWEAVGDIAYRLYHYSESADAYRRALALNGRADLHLKIGYALLKDDRPDQAAASLQAVLTATDDALADKANRLLTYLRQRQRFAESAD